VESDPARNLGAYPAEETKDHAKLLFFCHDSSSSPLNRVACQIYCHNRDRAGLVRASAIMKKDE
jgi:hypothetical protein